MTIPPVRISETDWTATPVGMRAGFHALVHQCRQQQEEIELLRAQPCYPESGPELLPIE